MTSKNLIVTLEIPPRPSEGRSIENIDGFDNIFRKARLAYVKTIGCDYYPITQYHPKLPHLLLWQKFACYEKLISGQYDKVLYMDADILITPHAPNIFEVIDQGIGVVADHWQLTPGSYDKKDRQSLLFNAGVMLCCRDAFSFFDIEVHRELLGDYHLCCDWPEGRAGEINEQDFFRMKLKTSDFPYTQLSEFWNYQPLFNDYLMDNPQVVEVRKKSGVNRLQAYMIHYTWYTKHILPYIDYEILYEGSKNKLLMWEELHQFAKLTNMCG